MKKLVSVLNLILPTILFYWVYIKWGIIPATCFSVLISGISLTVQYHKTKEISNISDEGF